MMLLSSDIRSRYQLVIYLRWFLVVIWGGLTCFKTMGGRWCNSRRSKSMHLLTSSVAN
jgi:hypothetical protein